jgi:hypothetical protein
MLRLMCVICICMATFPAFCEPAAKWEVATITDVKPHQAANDNGSDVVRYDVSVKVSGITYVVLYTDPFGMDKVKYAAGRELLVHVGKSTITYNDMLGRSLEVPIISQKPSTNAKQSK